MHSRLMSCHQSLLFIEFSNRRFLDVPTILSEPGVYRAVLSSQAVNNVLITAWQMFTAKQWPEAVRHHICMKGKQKESFQTALRYVITRAGADSKNSVQCGIFMENGLQRVCQASDLHLLKMAVLKGWMHNLSSAQQPGFVLQEMQAERYF